MIKYILPLLLVACGQKETTTTDNSPIIVYQPTPIIIVITPVSQEHEHRNYPRNNPYITPTPYYPQQANCQYIQIYQECDGNRRVTYANRYPQECSYQLLINMRKGCR